MIHVNTLRPSNDSSWLKSEKAPISSTGENAGLTTQESGETCTWKCCCVASALSLALCFSLCSSSRKSLEVDASEPVQDKLEGGGNDVVSGRRVG